MVNSIDEFLGREMDCIIVSCVRSSDEMDFIGWVNMLCTNLFFVFVLFFFCIFKFQSILLLPSSMLYICLHTLYMRF